MSNLNFKFIKNRKNHNPFVFNSVLWICSFIILLYIFSGDSDPKKIDSIKLEERLGFRKEAHFKKSLLIKGKWVDDIIYAILKTEWK